MLLRLLVCMLMSFEHVLKLNYELVLALKVLVSAQMSMHVSSQFLPLPLVLLPGVAHYE